MLDVALVGFGYWGPKIMKNLLAHEKCRLTWCCDIKKENLYIVKKENPAIFITTKIEDILNDHKVKAVILATPLVTHFELAKQALLAGKHVLVEKPFTQTLEQADELISLSRQKGLVLMVGQTYLYSPSILKIKEVFESSKLGKIHYINSTRVHFGHVRPNESVVWDLASHDLSIIFYWLQKYHYRVSCSGKDGLKRGYIDTADINLEFLDEGPLVNIFVSWLAPVKMRNMMISGRKKMIFFNDIRNDEKIKIYNQQYIKKEGCWTTRVGHSFSPNIDDCEPLKAEMDDFLSSIIEKRVPRSNALFNRHIIRALEAIDAAFKSGEKVTVNE